MYYNKISPLGFLSLIFEGRFIRMVSSQLLEM